MGGLATFFYFFGLGGLATLNLHCNIHKEVAANFAKIAPALNNSHRMQKKLAKEKQAQEEVSYWRQQVAKVKGKHLVEEPGPSAHQEPFKLSIDLGESRHMGTSPIAPPTQAPSSNFSNLQSK